MVRFGDIKKTGQMGQACARRARAGFTLVELLATMAILLLVGSIVATGVPVAQRAYTTAVDASNAQLLLSTCSTSLRDELAVANPATVEVIAPVAGETEQTYVSFESMETGYVTQIKYNSENGLFVQEALAGGVTGATPSTTLLVPGKAAAGAQGSLVAKIGSIAYDSASGVFTVNGLEVVRPDGTSLGDASIDELKVKTIADPVAAA